MRTIQVKQITKEEAINHKRNDYNPSAWKQIVELYSKDECKFFEDAENVYAIYIADGIRFCQQLSYSTCLSSGGLNTGCFYNESLIFIDAGAVANNNSNRKILREQTKKIPEVFYY